MNKKNLNERNIFAIPVGDYFDKNTEELQMIYSPFTENVFVASKQFVTSLEENISYPQKADEEIKNLLEEIMPPQDIKPFLEKGVLENGFNTLLILPNNICNFSCSYCYSALGRSNKKLNKETIKAALDNFIDPEKLTEKKAFISLLGGGEPMMTWDLTKYIIEYANERCDKFGIYLWMSLVTNGSILTDEMIELFKKVNIRIAVSFEILEEIQNLQRGQYAKVDENIQRLIAEGINVRIRSTITRESVKLQKKMIETVLEKYPSIENIILEEVTDEDHFNTPETLRAFYSEFLQYFNEAFELGKKHGKHVECSTFRNNNIFIDRFCPGVLCLSPEGTYTSCSRISSPNDKGYEESIYGKISDGKVEIDQQRLEELIRGYDVYSKAECETCFTKWHCGGGCYAHKHIYTQQTIDAICEYKREFTKMRLLQNLDEEYRNSQGVPLKEFILEQLQA